MATATETTATPQIPQSQVPATEAGQYQTQIIPESIQPITQPTSSPVSAPTPTVPTQQTTEGQVTDYLNQVQQSVIDQNEQAQSPVDFQNANESVIKEMEAVYKGEQTGPITPVKLPELGVAPEAPKMVDLFTNLRQQFGMDKLDATLNDLKAEEENVYARLRQRVANEKGKAVSMGVIGGRISETQAQEQENLDFIIRQKNSVTNMMNTSLSTINTIMSLTNTDYQNAKEAYDTNVKNSLTLYDMLSQQRSEAMSWQQQEKDFARANLQIYMNMIQEGSMQYDKLSEAQKTDIAKLEVTSGLGIGFMSSVKPPPGWNIKSITQRTDPKTGMGYADVIYVNPDGSIRVESKKTGKASLSQAEQIAQARQEASISAGAQIYAYQRKAEIDASIAGKQSQQQQQYLQTYTNFFTANAGGDGYVAPAVFKEGASRWVKNGGSLDDYYAQYRNYVNPSHWKDYGEMGKYFGNNAYMTE